MVDNSQGFDQIFSEKKISIYNYQKNIYQHDWNGYKTYFRILNLQDSHIPEDIDTLRIQVRKEHVSDFINQNIILVAYSKIDQVFIVVDPNSLVNKHFKTNSSINFSNSHVKLVPIFKIINPIISVYNSPLYLEQSVFLELLDFINYCRPASFAHLENIFDNFYKNVIFKITNCNIPKIQTYSRNLEYISTFVKSNKFVLSHLENNIFKKGLRNKFNAILPVEIFMLLKQEHKNLIITPNYIGFDNFTILLAILKSANSSNFFLISNSSISFRNKIDFYNISIAKFLNFVKDQCATGNDIDKHLSIILPTYTDRFDSWNSHFYRFKKRILAGKFKNENYFYDSYNSKIKDISESYSGYINYLEDKVKIYTHICDIYSQIYHMYNFANVYFFYKHLNRVLHAKNLGYFRGYLVDRISPNKYDDIIVRKIDDLFRSLSDNKIEFSIDSLIFLKKSKLFAYLESVFKVQQTDANLSIIFDLEYNEAYPFDHGGLICRINDERIGLFPLLFYESLYYQSLPVYFISQRFIYFLSNKSSKPVLKYISL